LINLAIFYSPEFARAYSLTYIESIINQKFQEKIGGEVEIPLPLVS